MKVLSKGIYEDLSNEDYHSSNGISRSALWEFNKLPQRYHYKYLSGKYTSVQDTEAMMLGNLVHTLVLEPHLFDERYKIAEPCNRRTKEGKINYEAMLLDAKDKILIKPEMYETGSLMAHSVFSNDLVCSMLTGAKIECSLYWGHEPSGILCKARPDILNSTICADLKTTRDASPKEFQRSAYSQGYFLQAAMMYQACIAHDIPFEKFVFICVEKEPPYTSALYVLDDEAINYGNELFNSLVNKYSLCVQRGEWPGYGVQTLLVPAWATKDIGNEAG